MASASQNIQAIIFFFFSFFFLTNALVLNSFASVV